MSVHTFVHIRMPVHSSLAQGVTGEISVIAGIISYGQHLDRRQREGGDELGLIDGSARAAELGLVGVIEVFDAVGAFLEEPECHKYIGHTYIGHGCEGHICIGRNYIEPYLYRAIIMLL